MEKGVGLRRYYLLHKHAHQAVKIIEGIIFNLKATTPALLYYTHPSAQTITQLRGQGRTVGGWQQVLL